MLSFVALDFFQKSPLLILPLIALGIFVTVFLTTTARALLTDKAKMDELAALPFRDQPKCRGEERHV
jgi:hypothetical protein